MKIYLLNKNVIAVEGRNAKIYNTPSGIYSGVDLYAADAAELLRNKFTELDEADELNGFEELDGEEVRIGHDLFAELADSELVFSDGEGIQIWSVQDTEDPADDVFCGTLEECRKYCWENDYIIGKGSQIARISVDDDFAHEMTEEIIKE